MKRGGGAQPHPPFFFSFLGFGRRRTAPSGAVVAPPKQIQGVWECGKVLEPTPLLVVLLLLKNQGRERGGAELARASLLMLLLLEPGVIFFPYVVRIKEITREEQEVVVISRALFSLLLFLGKNVNPSLWGSVMREEGRKR